jgi:hypothetical protein
VSKPHWITYTSAHLVQEGRVCDDNVKVPLESRGKVIRGIEVIRNILLGGEDPESPVEFE